MDPEIGKVIEKIADILKDNFDWIDIGRPIQSTDHLKDDLKLDSIAIVNLSVAIEDEFDIRFDPVNTDLTRVFETIDTLAQFVLIQVTAGS